MGRHDPKYLAVGHLSKAHGIDGEFVVSPLTDHPEGTFAPGVVLRMADLSGQSPDLDLPPLRVASCRPFKDAFLVKFGGVESRNEAEAIRGRYLLREASAVEPAAEGEFFYHQLLGLEVVTVQGTSLGRIHEVYAPAPCDLLEVRDGERETMIPFRKEVIVTVDLERGVVVVDPPDGLLDL